MEPPRKRDLRALRADQAEDADRDRLRSLLAERKISTQTIQTILQAVREQPELTSRSLGAMNAVGDGIFQSLRRVEVLQMQDGPTFDWEMCDPNLLLARTLEECPNLALIYAKAIRRHPCSEIGRAHV